MKTVAQLGSGKVPVGTTAYMGRAAHLLQCRSGVQKGEFSIYIYFSSSCYNNKLMIFSQYNSWVNDEVGFIYVAEDWLNPDAVLEAFEARALRMAVTCAKNLSKFENQEQGTLLTPWIQNNWLPCQLISQTTHKFFLSAGFQELLADLVEAAIAHCQLIVVSK